MILVECSNCGAENITNANFCMECGQKITNFKIKTSNIDKKVYEKELFKFRDLIIESMDAIKAIAHSISNLPLSAVNSPLKIIDEEKNKIYKIQSELKSINPPAKNLNCHKYFISSTDYYLESITELRRAIEFNSQKHMDNAAFYIRMFEVEFGKAIDAYSYYDSPK